MHLVKNVEKLPVWEIEVFAETVDIDDDPVSVAAVTFFVCCIGISTDSTFR